MILMKKVSLHVLVLGLVGGMVVPRQLAYSMSPDEVGTEGVPPAQLDQMTPEVAGLSDQNLSKLSGQELVQWAKDAKASVADLAKKAPQLAREAKKKMFSTINYYKLAIRQKLGSDPRGLQDFSATVDSIDKSVEPVTATVTNTSPAVVRPVTLPRPAPRPALPPQILPRKNPPVQKPAVIDDANMIAPSLAPYKGMELEEVEREEAVDIAEDMMQAEEQERKMLEGQAREEALIEEVAHNKSEILQIAEEKRRSSEAKLRAAEIKLQAAQTKLEAMRAEQEIANAQKELEEQQGEALNFISNAFKK